MTRTQPPRSIVVGIDGSDAGLRAARWAVDEAANRGLALRLVHVIEPGSKLSPVASSLAEELFRDSPPVWSELVNRDSVSSNSVKARRDLLHAMINAEGQEALGFEGFPAERGLYETLLKSTGFLEFKIVVDRRSGKEADHPVGP